jgi:hypothetical protein
MPAAISIVRSAVTVNAIQVNGCFCRTATDRSLGQFARQPVGKQHDRIYHGKRSLDPLSRSHFDRQDLDGEALSNAPVERGKP